MNKKETYNDSGIECPYCGYIEEEPEVIYDEEIETFRCPHCEKTMNANASMSWSWTAEKRTLGDIDEEIKQETENGEMRMKDFQKGGANVCENPYQPKIDALIKEKKEEH